MLKPELSLTAIFIFGILISGCATKPDLKTPNKLVVPEWMLEPCDRPTPLTRALPIDTANKAVEDARKLNLCADKHEGIVRIIRSQ